MSFYKILSEISNRANNRNYVFELLEVDSDGNPTSLVLRKKSNQHISDDIVFARKKTCSVLMEDECPVCSVCGSDIDESWIACPYCGSEIVK